LFTGTSTIRTQPQWCYRKIVVRAECSQVGAAVLADNLEVRPRFTNACCDGISIPNNMIGRNNVATRGPLEVKARPGDETAVIFSSDD